MKRKRVGVAMSGGVDSTACALILKADCEVRGFFMELAQPDIARQKELAQERADRIGIHLDIIDLKRQFKDKVLSYFSGRYFAGLTPNPCMVCNGEIKFGLFMEAMLAADMDLVATGHYARVHEDCGRYRLLAGTDRKKDQSYFLARLNQQQLSRVLFPLGAMRKEETYLLMERHGFADFRRQESQDICFLGRESAGDYLARLLPEKTVPGPVMTRDGRQIGTHRGLFRYTIGQRRGLGLPDATPWYVLAVEAEGNRIIVGKEDDLYSGRIRIGNLHWTAGRPAAEEIEYTVRIRYSHRGATAVLRRLDQDCYELAFAERQRAVTPGQFAVIYTGDEVVGAGEILR
ncbi:MAG: tRNA 2-thiouridine(34) synthase MnmA [Desulfocapsaceae bacterium]|nr:tRNA 2-thiouridine(34) synthase MnmA [Desulfocapsaceae bacterium]